MQRAWRPILHRRALARRARKHFQTACRWLLARRTHKQMRTACRWLPCARCTGELSKMKLLPGTTGKACAGVRDAYEQERGSLAETVAPLTWVSRVVALPRALDIRGKPRRTTTVLHDHGNNQHSANEPRCQCGQRSALGPPPVHRYGQAFFLCVCVCTRLFFSLKPARETHACVFFKRGFQASTAVAHFSAGESGATQSGCLCNGSLYHSPHPS